MKGTSLAGLGTSIALLIFAGHAFADGAYQRTDDRKKTLVWNNDPKPGDAAEWTGKRDAEGYAEGPGTLTWLQPQKQSLFSTGSNISGVKKVPIGRFTGTMTHGKFEGTVMTVDGRTVYYGKYVDGQRKGNWSREPIVAKAKTAEPASTGEGPKKASTSEPKVASAAKVEKPVEPKVSEAAEPEPPTEGPDSEASGPASAEVTAGGQKSDVRTPKASAPLIAQASSEADESATPRQQPVTRKAALAPGAVRAIEKPGQTVSQKTEKPKQAAEKIRKATKIETPKPEPSEEQVQSPAEGPRSTRIEKSQTPNPKAQAASSPPSVKEEPPTQLSAEETPVDNSIRTLTGPPTSLRVKSSAPPVATLAPEISAPAIAPATSSTNTPKLNAVQAMDIADIEARTKGYDLGDYQLPKAEYNASQDTWSVSYIGRGDKKSKPLSVTIQDKSGKAEVGK